jgi:hypothetical protein
MHCFPSSASRCSRRFTIIELLVILGVFSILASMLLPALKAAKDTGKRMKCLNNLKQIGLGFTMYVSDADGFFPCYQKSRHPYSWGNEHYGLEMALLPYLGVAEVPPPGFATGRKSYICPASPVKYRNFRYYHGKSDTEGRSDNTYEGLYYAYMGSEMYTSQDSPSASGIRQLTYTHPNAVPIQFCSRRLSPAWDLGVTCTGCNTYGKNNCLAASSWHRTKGYGPRPTAFLDGHAKSLRTAPYTAHGCQDILTGPYNTWQLEMGYGTPEHKPYDFWIDEF